MRVQRLIRWVSVFLLGAFGLLALDSLQVAGRYENAGRNILAPFGWAATSVVADVANIWSSVAEIGALERQNQELRAANAGLTQENLQLRQMGQDNATLRQLLAYKQAHPQHSYHPAAVIAYGTNNLDPMLTIDQGSNDGIQASMAVVDSAGLVGQISHVAAHSAVILPINNPGSSVAAYVTSKAGGPAGKTDPTGVVQFEPGVGLLLNFVQATAPLQAGDWVLTSGLGGTFPRGVPIARISQIRQRPVDLFQIAVLTPVAAMQTDRQVLVITDFVAHALPPAGS